jgi:hypothetical protein
MQRTAVVPPFRAPASGLDIEPDTYGKTNTLPGTAGTEAVAVSIASCSASRTTAGTAGPLVRKRGEQLVRKDSRPPDLLSIAQSRADAFRHAGFIEHAVTPKVLKRERRINA